MLQTETERERRGCRSRASAPAAEPERVLRAAGSAARLWQEAGRLTLPFLPRKRARALPPAADGGLGCCSWALASERERTDDWFFDSLAIVSALTEGNAASPSIQLFPWHVTRGGTPLSFPRKPLTVFISDLMIITSLLRLFSRRPLGWAAVVPGDGPCSPGARDEWLGMMTGWTWVSSEDVGQFQPWAAASSVRSVLHLLTWRSSLLLEALYGEPGALLTAGGGSRAALPYLLRWDAKPCCRKSRARQEAAWGQRNWWQQDMGAGGRRATRSSGVSGGRRGWGGHASFHLRFLEKGDCVIWRPGGDPDRLPRSYCHPLWWVTGDA